MRRAANTLFSGPVGGTIAAVAVARDVGSGRLICVDMGGTSFDVSLVVDGAAEVESQLEIAGHPVLTPSVAVTSLGAGGGSIAYVESGGLRVGPESAGAIPGPACYGRGGTRPTVTDANLLLGRIPETALLGGTIALDRDAATAAVEPVAAELGLGTLELAEGIVAVANALMADAIREVTVARGIDPRDFDLLAFGGAGPLHAVALAEELEIARVVVPAGPGDALGLGDAAGLDPPRLRARVLPRPGDGRAGRPARRRDRAARGGRVRAARRRRRREPRPLRRERRPALPRPGVHAQRAAPRDGDTAELARRFTDAHHARYGHSNPSERIEVVNLRVAALGAGDPLPVEPLAADVAPAPDAVVEAVFDGSPLATPLYARAALGTGSEVTGPCIVLEEGCTTLVPPGWRGTTTPGRPPAAGARPLSVDPVSVEVIRNAFNSIARQMNNNLARSAYTPIIYEMKDCSVGIFDAEARLLGQSPGLPMFLGNLETGIVATTEALGGPDGYRPGDVFMINDPYLVGSHTNDVVVFSPIFLGDALIGFGATKAHWLDIGAKDAGRPVDTTEIFQEGYRLGPTHLYREGEPVQEVIDLLMRNSRLPRSVWGDMHAQITACRTGERRLVALHERFGSETVAAAARRSSTSASGSTARRSRRSRRRLPAEGRWTPTAPAASRCSVASP